MICMSDLVLDPPSTAHPPHAGPPHAGPSDAGSGLRLVSSTGIVDRTDRYRTSAPLLGDARRLYCDVLAHALSDARRLNPDALRVVLSVKQSRGHGALCLFTTHDVWRLLFVDVVAWCRGRRLRPPSGAAVALEAVIDYLASTGSFHPDSDPVQALLGAIDECTGGWTDQPPQPPRPRRSVRSMGGTEPR